MSCPLDSERRKTLQEVVGKVQGLVRAARLGWGMVASPYTIHGGNKFLWTVGGVELEVNGSDVARMILRNLEAVWGVGSMVGCWVENRLSAYVVIWGIPEREWLSEKSGAQGLIDGNLGIIWGPRQQTVISRAWNRVDVKVEIMTAEAARGAVVRGLVYCGMTRTVQRAVGGGRASVLRVGPWKDATERIGRRGPRMAHKTPCGPWKVGRRGMPPAGACVRCKETGHWKNECPNVPGMVARG